MCYTEPKTTLLHHTMFGDKIFQSPCYLQLGGSLYLSLTGEGGLGLEDGHPWPGETCDVRLSDVTSFISSSQSSGHDQRLSQSLPGLNGGLPSSRPMWDPMVSLQLSVTMWVMRVWWECDEDSPLPGYNLINSDNSSHNLPNSSLSFVAPSKVLRAQMGK